MPTTTAQLDIQIKTTQNSRMSERKVSTPIDSFAHPETGSQIDLVSVVHVGTPSYFKKLGSHIVGRQDEGFTVHYEATREDHEFVESASLRERTKWHVKEALVDEFAEIYSSIASGSSYTIQNNSSLFRNVNSENHDLSESELVRQISLITLLTELRRARKNRHKFEKATSKGPEFMDETVFGVIKKSVDTAKSGKAPNKRKNRVIIQARNQVALEGVDAAVTESPGARLVLVWGIGHLAGLRSGLLDKGYEHTNCIEIDLATSRA